MPLRSVVGLLLTVVCINFYFTHCDGKYEFPIYIAIVCFVISLDGLLRDSFLTKPLVYILHCPLSVSRGCEVFNDQGRVVAYGMVNSFVVCIVDPQGFDFLLTIVMKRVPWITKKMIRQLQDMNITYAESSKAYEIKNILEENPTSFTAYKEKCKALDLMAFPLDLLESNPEELPQSSFEDVLYSLEMLINHLYLNGEDIAILAPCLVWMARAEEVGGYQKEEQSEE